jgi:hypothetical protein
MNDLRWLKEKDPLLHAQMKQWAYIRHAFLYTFTTPWSRFMWDCHCQMVEDVYGP